MNTTQLHNLNTGDTFSVEVEGEDFYYIKGDYAGKGCFDCVGQWGAEIEIHGLTYVNFCFHLFQNKCANSINVV